MSEEQPYSGSVREMNDRLLSTYVDDPIMREATLEMYKQMEEGQDPAPTPAQHPTLAQNILLSGFKSRPVPSQILDRIIEGKVYSLEVRPNNSARVLFVDPIAGGQFVEKHAEGLILPDTNGLQIITVQQDPDINMQNFGPDATRTLNMNVIGLASPAGDELTAGWYTLDVNGGHFSGVPAAFDGIIYPVESNCVARFLNIPSRLETLARIRRFVLPGDGVIHLQLQYLSIRDAVEDWAQWRTQGLTTARMGPRVEIQFGVDPVRS